MINLIWDIDGTILDTGGAGVLPMCQAINKVLDLNVTFDRREMSGLTDHQIIRKLVTLNSDFDINLTTADEILRDYSNELRTKLAISPAQVLGEVSQFLLHTNSNFKYKHFIASGNCQSGGETKLKNVGLIEYFEPSRRFFSTNFMSRKELISRALASIEGKSLVIGDTIHDAIAAFENNIPVIIVGERDSFPHLDYAMEIEFIERNWKIVDLENAIGALCNRH